MHIGCIMCICEPHTQYMHDHVIGNCDMSSEYAMDVGQFDFILYEYSVCVCLIYTRFSVQRENRWGRWMRKSAVGILDNTFQDTHNVQVRLLKRTSHHSIRLSSLNKSIGQIKIRTTKPRSGRNSTQPIQNDKLFLCNAILDTDEKCKTDIKYISLTKKAIFGTMFGEDLDKS